ncbi:MAG TPA: NADPH:quinone oxidoreductase family protein, partial [Gammaproteobacteria bacterium]
ERLEMGRMPDPECGPGEVEIMVKACGVNFADLLLISGRYQLRPAQPFVPGMEAAGRVTRVGEGVDGISTGDKVAAYVKHGGYADRVVAPMTQVAVLPESISSTAAAAFPVSYASAELAFERASLAAGEVVLIGGAAGAIGTACVELARQRGATVIACVGDREKEELARACGAQHVVSSHSRNLGQDLQAVAPDGIDVIIDPVGGNFFEDSLRALRFGGRLVVLGFASGKISSLRLNHLLVKHQSVIGSSFGLSCIREPAAVAARWPKLVALLEQGQIKPRVGRTLPFTELPKALNLLKERRVAGRIVLSG